MTRRSVLSLLPLAPSAIDVTAHGAKPGEAVGRNTAAFDRAARACESSGGGTLYVPPGRYLTGPIRLGSNTVLHLAPGAVIQGSPSLADYPVEKDPVSGESARAGLITFRDAANVAITGLGTIDGNPLPFHRVGSMKPGRDWDRRHTRQGELYMDPRFGADAGPYEHAERPGNLVRFVNCRRARIEGVTISNSPTWTVLFHGCRDVVVDGVTIHSEASGLRIPNDDGIDVRDSRNVRIANADIHTGDDCIALFGSRDVTVANCTLAARSAGIRVGYAEGDTARCTFQNLTIDSNCGLKVNVRAGGSVEDVIFSNIVIRAALTPGHWWGKGEPLHLSALPGTAGAAKLGRIRGVRFSNILAQCQNSALAWGSPASPIEDLLVQDVDLWMRNGPLLASYGGNFDLRGAAEFSRALFRHDTPGVFLRHVHGARLRQVRLRWEAGLPDFCTHAVEAEECRDLDIQGFEGPAARPGVERFALRKPSTE